MAKKLILTVVQLLSVAVFVVFAASSFSSSDTTRGKNTSEYEAAFEKAGVAGVSAEGDELNGVSAEGQSVVGQDADGQDVVGRTIVNP